MVKISWCAFVRQCYNKHNHIEILLKDVYKKNFFCFSWLLKQFFAYLQRQFWSLTLYWNIRWKCKSRNENSLKYDLFLPVLSYQDSRLIWNLTDCFIFPIVKFCFFMTIDACIDSSIYSYLVDTCGNPSILNLVCIFKIDIYEIRYM